MARLIAKRICEMAKSVCSGLAVDVVTWLEMWWQFRDMVTYDEA